MATSQNGYRANDRSLIASYEIPGGKVAVRKGDVATVLVYFAKRFHSEVEPLKWPGNWGYAERTIRGNSTTLSNHASGTALDLNAPQHPLGKVGTFSSKQVAAINRILADCDGVLRHGKNYSGRKDEMHVEINKGTAAVAALADKIRAGKKPGPKGGATSSGGGGSSWTSVSGKTPTVRQGNKGEPVKRIQKAVGVKVDGYFGASTKAAVMDFQRKYKLGVDGIVGKATWAKINAGKKAKAKKPRKSQKAPKFPLKKGHWYGVESRNAKNHSGVVAKDRAGIKQLQAQLKKRGWKLSVDGRFGAKTKRVVIAFQKEKGLKPDGLVGLATWKKIWESPVT
ncbi:peptidoglycan-binding protein [Brevibacterium sp. CSND-B09]|uniref:peptidoglycan-binding protein n=1 Tax=Brevibacterium sp. CSND-B09 TaxID=3462571 RepID=UPI00406A299B